MLVGFVDRNEGRGKPFHNAAALLERGKPIRKTYKSLLPTYDVFDEDRYFEPATRVEPFEVQGKKIGVTICEDIWTDDYLPRPLYDVEPVRALVEQGAEIILNLSASPFRLGAPACRLEMVAAQARDLSTADLLLQRRRRKRSTDLRWKLDRRECFGRSIAQLAAFREDEKIVDTTSIDAIEFREAKTAGATFRRAFTRASRLLAQMQLPFRGARSERRNRFRSHRGHRGRCARR